MIIEIDRQRKQVENEAILLNRTGGKLGIDHSSRLIIEIDRQRGQVENEAILLK